MQVLIGADIVPTQSNKTLFTAGDAKSLVGERLLALLQGADLRILNLETPLTDADTPISKCGANFRAPTDTVAGMKALGIDVVTLANNHILDQGQLGLATTCRTLAQAGIAHFGTGLPGECETPWYWEKDGKRIGFYACAEHEFSIAEEKCPGANPFDPLETPDHIGEMKKNCDFAVVLYHGGKEHYRYPSPALQKTCRKLVEKGADLVICQHSHCIGCEEKYLQGTIVYGQGNFLFDHGDNEYRNTALLVRIGDDFSVDYIPVCKDGASVRLAEPAETEEILKGFYDRSREITEPGAVKSRYEAFAKQNRQHYLLTIKGVRQRSFGNRVLNRLTGGRWLRWRLRRYEKEGLLTLQNFVECEAHRELLIQMLTGNED